MTEETIVRQNLIDDINYRPYCGNVVPRPPVGNGCSNPRTQWKQNLKQFVCPLCGWTSKFPDDFIIRYTTKHNLK